LVEGTKSVLELLRSDYEIIILAAFPDYLHNHNDLIEKNCHRVYEVSLKELSKLGSLKNNDGALAVARMIPNHSIALDEDNYVLMLDRINDPGNLGTLIRIADWYAFHGIICSENTVDQYNPKVISSSKGSFTRVKLYYTNLEEFLSKTNLPVYGTYLEGMPVYTCDFDAGIILLGNESHGIDERIESFVTHKITIPGFGKAESLNAAIAGAVICDNIRRSEFLKK